jgi:DNA-binding response OmpR family regulator
MAKVLIIEDDPTILEGLKAYLVSENYKVVTAKDGEEGFRLGISELPDAILLDIMLPKKNGLDVCRDLRANGLTTPIIMLTSKTEELDKILGLEIGADDYITKPFSIREVHARLRAHLRRSEMTKPTTNPNEKYQFGPFSVDWANQEVKRNNIHVEMSAKEFQVLKYFIEREGRIVTREMLLDDVWGYENFPTTRTVDNYILSLRKIIEIDPSKPVHILTVHTKGYRFVKESI